MGWRILVRSLKGHKARLALAILSVVLGASLVASLTNLSLDIPQKASAQLRAYGANILILPYPAPGTGETYLDEKDLSYLGQGDIAPFIASYVPYLYSGAETGGQKLVLAGTRWDKVRETSTWWQVAGRWPLDGGEIREALAGAQVAEKLGLGPGDEITVGYKDNRQTFRVVGIVSTGAAEDSQLFVALEAAHELTGLAGKVSLVQVSALAQSYPLPDLARLMERGLPGTEVRVVGQIARAERQVLDKVQLLLALVAGLLLLASGLVVLSTMTTSLLERTAEIGLMKTLGASNLRIAWLFGAEAIIIAASGGVLGYLLGYALAQFISQQVFGASVAPHPLAFVLTMAVASGVTLLASALPFHRALSIAPALILRED